MADWYEENKYDFDYKVWECVFHDGKGEKTGMSEWISRTENAFTILVNMHQFGYEVKKEKRYLVTLKNRQPLVKSQPGNTLYFSKIITAGNYKASRKELEEAGFGWVFDCEGVEVQEVE